MKGLILSLQFLTRLPMPQVVANADDFASSIRWFPVAGMVVGAVVAGAAWGGGRIDPWTGALLGLLAWVWVTGALHLDGLADLADAHAAAHKGRDRLLAVLAHHCAAAYVYSDIPRSRSTYQSDRTSTASRCRICRIPIKARHSL